MGSTIDGVPPVCGGNMPLREKDGELYTLVQKEKTRQRQCIELIASENFTSRAVMECLGSCLTNKYSEGYPGRRYYGGTEHIDSIELLCQKRALKAFELDEESWGVNVQPYSGSPANLEAYMALLKPHDRIMGLDLPSGGHLTHGFYTAKKKVSATSIFFESLPYKVNEETGYIDYDQLHSLAKVYRPQLIVAGISAYPRNLDYKRFREIADDVGAYLLADMAHVSGLVAAKLVNNPFEFCDIVTTTSHKSLRGPRAGMIYFNKKCGVPDIEQRVNDAVFPSLQGGPHNHQIAALACQLQEVASPMWRPYAEQILKNCAALSKFLLSKGYKLVTDGTDTHLLLWDLRNMDISGAKMQEVCDAADITLNKNSVPGDASALSPSGVRIGSPAMTSRGLKEKDFEMVGEFLHRSVEICQKITASHGKKLVDFRNGIVGNKDIAKLKNDVQEWASKFPLPGLIDI